MSVHSAVEPVDEQIAKIRARLVDAIELANDGGPALGQAALDVEVLLSVVDAHLLSWRQGYDVGYANGVTDTQLQAYEEAQS